LITTVSLLLTLPISVVQAKTLDLSEARAEFNSGKYAECLAAATEATGGDYRHIEGWWLLKCKTELTTGKYAEALATYEAANGRFPSSAELKLLGYEAYRMNDRPAEADALLVALRQSAADAPWRYSDTPSRVALGKSLLLGGADARQVLELFFDTARKQSPRAPEPYLATSRPNRSTAPPSATRPTPTPSSASPARIRTMTTWRPRRLPRRSS
jgi:hypothetical protein